MILIYPEVISDLLASDCFKFTMRSTSKQILDDKGSKTSVEDILGVIDEISLDDFDLSVIVFAKNSVAEKSTLTM
jgi:hypothetical protein